jgi:hypothetical protein
LLRIERQQALRSLQPVQDRDAEEMEAQQGDSVLRPTLLLRWIYAGETIEAALEGERSS